MLKLPTNFGLSAAPWALVSFYLPKMYQGLSGRVSACFGCWTSVKVEAAPSAGKSRAALLKQTMIHGVLLGRSDFCQSHGTLVLCFQSPLFAAFLSTLDSYIFLPWISILQYRIGWRETLANPLWHFTNPMTPALCVSEWDALKLRWLSVFWALNLTHNFGMMILINSGWLL